MRSNQVATVVAPDGSQFPVYQHGDGYYWGAGYLASTVERVFDLVHVNWDVECIVDNTYARAEAGFADSRVE